MEDVENERDVSGSLKGVYEEIISAETACSLTKHTRIESPGNSTNCNLAVYNSFAKVLNVVHDFEKEDFEYLIVDLTVMFQSFEPITLACKDPGDTYYALVNAIINQIDLPPGSNKVLCIKDLDKLYNLTHQLNTDILNKDQTKILL